MAKKKADPQESPATSKPEVAAPDDETRPDVNIVPEVTPPGSEAPEPEAPAATQALPLRPDPRAKTSPPGGTTTRPMPVDSLQLAENRDRTVQDEDTKTDHVPSTDRVTGPLPEEARTPRYTTTPLPREPKRTRSGMSPWVWALLGASSMLILAGAIWFFYLRPSDTKAVSAPEPEVPESSTLPPAVPEVDVPPALRPYMEKAQKGDAKAMAMLAVMYDNGLNVRQDKAEGRKWYEKAAAGGNASAKKWLAENPKK